MCFAIPVKLLKVPFFTVYFSVIEQYPQLTKHSLTDKSIILWDGIYYHNKCNIKVYGICLKDHLDVSKKKVI